MQAQGFEIYNKQTDRGMLHTLIPNKGRRIRHLMRLRETTTTASRKSFHHGWAWVLTPSKANKEMYYSLGIPMTDQRNELTERRAAPPVKKGHDLSARIKHGREKLGITQAELARMTGLSRAMISQYEQGVVKELRMEKLITLSKALKMSAEELAVGTASADGPSRIPVNLVPVLQIDQVRESAALIGSPLTYEALIKMATTKAVSKYAFAIEITGDEMSSPDSPFRPGGFVIFDPEAKAESGDCVLASCDDGTPMFRQLRITGDRHTLRPMNSQYTAIETNPADYTVFGVAVQYLTDIKLA